MRAERNSITILRESITRDESGFSLVELIVASSILLIISAWLFSLLAETERSASYQTEVQAVLSNARIAMDTIQRSIRSTGNNPHDAGFAGLAITGPTEIRLRSDITGSDPLDPNKGDPDGDTNDLGEDLTIRYNADQRSIEMVTFGGTVQTIANYISTFSMQYFDASGVATTVGDDVRKVRVTITCASTLAHPQTQKVYGMTISSDVQLGSRQ